MTSRSNTHIDKVIPMMPVSVESTKGHRTGEWRQFNPVHENHYPPCNHNCPIGIDIQKMTDLVTRKEYRQAYDDLRSVNPLPSICGRVCHHPCENSCNRREFDEAVSIHYLERFVGDWGMKNVKTKPAKRDDSKGTIAIIGAGPAGISCAWHLLNKGYGVTVFESTLKAGGRLRHGLPEFRLPRKILDSEIHSLIDLGMDLRTGIKIGSDLKFEDLREFRAILIAVGAGRPKPLPVPGEELRGVQSAAEFLKEVNAGHRERIEGSVVIFGGNSMALDAARAVIRLGGKATIIFRHTVHEMSAQPEEIEEAVQEGVEINTLALPLAVKKAESGFRLMMRKLNPSKRSAGKAKSTTSVNGSKFELAADLVLVALGEEPDLSFLPAQVHRQTWGLNTGGIHQTNVENIFAAGDCADDRHGICDAIGAGKDAALSIDRYLRGEKLYASPEEKPLTHFADLNIAYFDRVQAHEKKKLSLEKRIKTFSEVSIGLEESEVEREALRCFSCGVCNACDNCITYCPDRAIVREGITYSVNLDYCKGCGICIHECPRDAIHLVPRERIASCPTG